MQAEVQLDIAILDLDWEVTRQGPARGVPAGGGGGGGGDGADWRAAGLSSVSRAGRPTVCGLLRGSAHDAVSRDPDMCPQCAGLGGLAVRCKKWLLLLIGRKAQRERDEL